MSQAVNPFARPVDEASVRLEAALERFEDAWHQGTPPTLADFLPEDPTKRSSVLRELIHTDLEYRHKSGAAVPVESYLGAFPELASDRTLVVDLLVAEFELRQRFATQPDPTEYQRRFPDYSRELASRLPQASQPDEPRRTRLGKYVLHEIAGRGAFGVVYRAHDTELDRTVAVKLPRLGSLTAPEDRERFLREARSAAQLHHPNIVAVYDVGEVDGVCFLVNEFVAGTSLADRLIAGRFSVTETAQLLAQVAQALHYAHQHGVVHRDIKPGNILLQRTNHGRHGIHGKEEGRETQGECVSSSFPCLPCLPWFSPKISDFGLAKRDTGEITLTQTGQVLGTPAYLSPEQARGEASQVDGRTDIYSLGVVLYEMLTGELPFRGTVRTLLRQVLEDEPPRPRRLNAQIPRDLETIVLKAMAKEPADRYATAGALAEDLQRYLADQPITARRTSFLERSWRWCRRHPRPALLATATVLLATIAGVSLAVNWLLSGRVQVAEQHEQTAKELAQTADVKSKEEEQTAREERFQSLVTGAFSAERTEALRAIDEACGLLPHVRAGEAQRLQLRNACIAALCRAELRVATQIPHRVVPHPRGPSAAAFDARLYRLARTDERGVIRVCAVSKGHERELVRFPGPGYPACALVFSPDGRYLTAEYSDPNRPSPVANQPPPNLVQLWDCEHPEKPLFTPPFVVYGRPGFSPDSRWLAIPRAEEVVVLYELGPQAQGRVVRELMTEKREGQTVWDYTVVAFHPHEPRLAVSRERGLVEMLDLAEPAGARSVILYPVGADGRPSKSTARVRSLAWSADGSLLAVARTHGRIDLWQPAATRKFVGVLSGHTEEVREVAFSPNGRLLASKSLDKSVRLWDVVGRREIAAWSPNTHIGCASLAFSEDGQRLGFGWDGTHLCLWDVASGWELQTFPTTDLLIRGVPTVGFSPDGKLLAIVDRKQAQLWDWASGTLRAAVPIRESWAFHFGADGQELLLNNRQGVVRWRFGERGEPGASLEPVWNESPLFQSSFSPHDSKLLARTGKVASGPALLLDLVQRREVLRIPEEAHPGLRNVALCPDQRWMATGTMHGKDVCIHALPGGELRHTLEVPSSADVRFSRDGRWLVIGTGKNVQFWKVGAWALEHTLEAQPGDFPVVVSLSDDNSLSALQFSATRIRLFGADGRYHAEIALPPGDTLSWLSLSGDGQRLAAGCLGTHIYLWDLMLIRKQLRERGLDW